MAEPQLDVQDTRRDAVPKGDSMNQSELTNEKTPVSLPARQCAYTKPDGRCKANAQLGSTFCFFHDPEVAEERQAARVNGGKERSRRVTVLSADTPDMPVDTAANVIRLLTETINHTLRGELDPRIGNSVGYLAAIVLKAQQRDELDQRVAHLESILARQPANYEADSEVEFVNPDSRS
jgi:hypothetical protein